MFNHILLDKNKVKSSFAKLIRNNIVERIIDDVVDGAIGFAEDAYTRLFTDNVPISDISLDVLIDSLVIILPGEENNPTVIPDPTRVALVLDEINNRENGVEQFADRIVELNNQWTYSPAMAARVNGLPEVALCALGELSCPDRPDRGGFLRSGWDDVDGGREARRRVRACSRSSQDGKRVSREKHEWDYVRGESAQWAQMLEAVERFSVEDTAESQTFAALGIPDSVAGYTYGNFVDLAFCRKAVAQIRKVRRLVRAANVKEILRITNQDPEQLVNELVIQIDFTRCLDEMKEYFS